MRRRPSSASSGRPGGRSARRSGGTTSVADSTNACRLCGSWPPDDLRPDADVRVDPFTLVFETEDEFAAELANRTVHTAMHLGWSPGDAGRYVCRMTVLVRPNGRLGAFYMTAIKPLRSLFVYPALLRSIGRRWEASASAR